MKHLVIGAVLAVATLAATPGDAQQAPQPEQRQIRFNLTPAGEAVAKRYLGTPDPEAKALVARMGELKQRQLALVAAPKLDMVQFAAVLRQQEQMQSQVMRRGNDRMMQMLREMGEADRTSFLRSLANPTAAPAPAPAPKK